MLGILCEKPSAARNFATALGGNFGTYNGEEYIITNISGHMYEFADPEYQVPEDLKEKYHKWALSTLPWDCDDFSWKKEVRKDKKTGKTDKRAVDQLKSVKATLSKCDEIAIATDCDPSGEGNVLAWEVLLAAGLKPQKWSRFVFDDEAPASIQKAFKTRVTLAGANADPDYAKGLFRSQWDLMSMQFTRIASCLTGAKLRQGRLKSFMVIIVGDALKAYLEYKKIPFYQWKFKDENGVTYTNKEEPRFPTREEVQPNKYSSSTVTIDSTEQKHQAPPKLPDLAKLAATLAPAGYNAKLVQDVYQKMYEDQVVSYPRTEDKEITPEQFAELLPLANKIAGVVGVDTSLLTHRQPRNTHVKTGGSHGANRPGPSVPSSLQSLDQKYGDCASAIYSVLAKAYLAMLCEDYIYTQQKGHVTDYPEFKGVANCPVSMGYKSVYDDEDKDDENKEPDTLLGSLAEPFIHEGFPPRPPYPTQKWLMVQLEKYDVGTGATRNSTFAEITSLNPKSAPLMICKKGKLSFTDAGQMSYLILPGTNIGSLDLTKQIHDYMSGVANGSVDAHAVLKDVERLVKEDIETMKANLPAVQASFKDAGKTTKVEKEKATGVHTPTGTEVSFSREFCGHRFSDTEVQTLLNGGEIEFTAVSPKSGKEFPAKGTLAEQEYSGRKYWGFKLAEREAQPLPEDKVEGYYAPKKTTIRFKKEWGGHTFTESEIEELLAGNEISFDATSKTGKTYTAKGKLAQQTYNGSKYWGFKADFGK